MGSSVLTLCTRKTKVFLPFLLLRGRTFVSFEISQVCTSSLLMALPISNIDLPWNQPQWAAPRPICPNSARWDAWRPIWPKQSYRGVLWGLSAQNGHQWVLQGPSAQFSHQRALWGLSSQIGHQGVFRDPSALFSHQGALRDISAQISYQGVHQSWANLPYGSIKSGLNEDLLRISRL